MSNFIIDCINGDALLSEINDYIDQWHNSNSNLPLHTFLGMEKKEYVLFVEDENYLGIIVTARKYKKDFTFIIREEMSMAARSNDPVKAKQLQRWLESEGLWE